MNPFRALGCGQAVAALLLQATTRAIADRLEDDDGAATTADALEALLA